MKLVRRVRNVSLVRIVLVVRYRVLGMRLLLVRLLILNNGLKLLLVYLILKDRLDMCLIRNLIVVCRLLVELLIIGMVLCILNRVVLSLFNLKVFNGWLIILLIIGCVL